MLSCNGSGLSQLNGLFQALQYFPSVLQQYHKPTAGHMHFINKVLAFYTTLVYRGLVNYFYLTYVFIFISSANICL